MKEKIFVICPVRNVTKKESKTLDDYVARKESEGYKVHYPPRDTNQVDSTGGFKILYTNTTKLIDSGICAIYWNTRSKGSFFDLANSFNQYIQGKQKVELINYDEIKAKVNEQKNENINKSFEQVLLKLHEGYKLPKK